MSHLKIAVFVAVLALAGPVLPQTGERGSTPPGTSQDGSRPADGAIKGGSILPGETSGMPNKLKCDQLTGTLREDCLRQERERDAAAGSSGVPQTPPSPTVTTPPQNPNPTRP